IGETYGRTGARAGLTPSETLEAFLYFRFPVVRTVSGLIEEQALAAKRAVRLFAEINYFMDQVLLATMQAHESAARAFGGGAQAIEPVRQPGPPA
ncbi:MAG TPA: hypothetical protein VFI22_14145, partial [Thermomicrobiales bacterium]|nr:hypothetical protein [Thermomicrobiales bacterium]